jgi:FKBP-type peptidyl-prolyl cis-trans isomerase
MSSLEGTKLTKFDPVPSVTQLQIIDIVPGTGDEVPVGATVTAHYTGALAADGTIFQSSHDLGRPATFPLSGVIQGWQEGVPGMKVGGTRRLIIPAADAYGAQSPAPNIPANSDLVFDIELIAIS